jgi:hypothetical protein
MGLGKIPAPQGRETTGCDAEENRMAATPAHQPVGEGSCRPGKRGSAQSRESGPCDMADVSCRGNRGLIESRDGFHAVARSEAPCPGAPIPAREARVAGQARRGAPGEAFQAVARRPGADRLQHEQRPLLADAVDVPRDVEPVEQQFELFFTSSDPLPLSACRRSGSIASALGYCTRRSCLTRGAFPCHLLEKTARAVRTCESAWSLLERAGRC